MMVRETHPHHPDYGSRDEPEKPDDGVATPPTQPGSSPRVGVVERGILPRIVVVFAVHSQQRRPRAQHRPILLSLQLGDGVESRHILQAHLARHRLGLLHPDVLPRARLVHVSGLARAPEPKGLAVADGVERHRLQADATEAFLVVVLVGVLLGFLLLRGLDDPRRFSPVRRGLHYDLAELHLSAIATGVDARCSVRTIPSPYHGPPRRAGRARPFGTRAESESDGCLGFSALPRCPEGKNICDIWRGSSSHGCAVWKLDFLRSADVAGAEK